MNEVEVDQKSYQMPPQDGFTVAYFLTVAAAAIKQSPTGSMFSRSRPARVNAIASPLCHPGQIGS